ncbi:MAG: hypothetical protein HQM16_03150 [Deltaproteobacteria bacterium]|nr:hypothetical protein [Deltaproteobacteria bacterium]
MKRILFFCSLVIFFSSTVITADARATGLEGIALVKIKSKHVSMEIEQAVRVNDETALFVGLDDFGGEVFRLSFTPVGLLIIAGAALHQPGAGKLKKILSMPLTEQEFISVIRYQTAGGFDVINTDSKSVWTHKKHKDLQVVFDDFREQKKPLMFPEHFCIQFKGHYLDLVWKKIKFTQLPTK